MRNGCSFLFILLVSLDRSEASLRTTTERFSPVQLAMPYVIKGPVVRYKNGIPVVRDEDVKKQPKGYKVFDIAYLINSSRSL